MFAQKYCQAKTSTNYFKMIGMQKKKLRTDISDYKSYINFFKST